jgi:filamentous hemagglutinin family protein
MHRILSAVAVSLSFCAAPPALSMPVSPFIASGTASIQANGSTLDLTLLSPSVIIDWQSFSLGASDVMRVFAADGWALLNRVLAPGASMLDGRLDAQGNFGLVNLSGIAVGSGSLITGGDLLLAAVGVPGDSFASQAAAFTGFPYQWQGATGAVTLSGAVLGHSVFIAGDSIVVPQGGSLTVSNIFLLEANQITIDDGGALSTVPLPPALVLLMAGFGVLLPFARRQGAGGTETPCGASA